MWEDVSLLQDSNRKLSRTAACNEQRGVGVDSFSYMCFSRAARAAMDIGKKLCVMDGGATDAIKLCSADASCFCFSFFPFLFFLCCLRAFLWKGPAQDLSWGCSLSRP